jgi:hypothetical protein
MDAAEDRTGMVQKALTAAEVKERSAELADAEIAREELIEKKRSHNREWNEQLKQSRILIGKLASEVQTGKAWVSAQTGMFDGDDDDEPAPPRQRRQRRSRPPAASNDNSLSPEAAG